MDRRAGKWDRRSKNQEGCSSKYCRTVVGRAECLSQSPPSSQRSMLSRWSLTWHLRVNCRRTWVPRHCVFSRGKSRWLRQPTGSRRDAGAGCAPWKLTGSLCTEPVHGAGHGACISTALTASATVALVVSYMRWTCFSSVLTCVDLTQVKSTCCDYTGKARKYSVTGNFSWLHVSYYKPWGLNTHAS